jgi:N-acetylglucosamine kinase-like BadF-type ATPase
MSVIRRAGHVCVGVDAGGTWVRVVVTRHGCPIARVRRPATDVRELGKFLRATLRRCGHRPRDVAALVVASRGIWTARERGAAQRQLHSLARQVRVLSDAQAALLGALGGAPGILVLAGTGSIVLGRSPRGRWARAGGLGPLLGDEGSAFWLGREWLRATTRGEDFLPARALVRSPDPVRRIAALAPAVIARARRGDRRARAIVRRGQEHLAESAVRVARRLSLSSPVAVSWAGSVLHDPAYRAGVKRAVRRAGIAARWLPPAEPPVCAAARFAERIAGRRNAGRSGA